MRREDEVMQPARDVLAALDALGQAAAVLAPGGGRVLGATAALRAAWPASVGLTDLPRWMATVPGLAAGLGPLLEGGDCDSRAFHCGHACAFAVRLVWLDPQHALLHVSDEGQVLRRQLGDREQLMALSRSVSVGEMGSTLAHELNQPIGAISNLLRGLRVRLLPRARSGGAGEQELAALDRAIDQVMYAAKVIARIRDFTHSHAPRMRRLDATALVHTSVTLLDWDMQRSGVRTHIDAPPGPLWVSADEVMLQQVLVNVLRNALDALREAPPAAPRVTLRLSPDAAAGELTLTVADNGAGMSGEARARLFTPFTSHKPGGMGIGLAICRSFIELHQGRLWFSHPESGGCEVHIGLPLHPSESGAPS